MSATGSHAGEKDLPQKKREPYEKPRVLASYDQEELEAAMQLQGDQGGAGGCGCSGGSLLPKKGD